MIERITALARFAASRRAVAVAMALLGLLLGAWLEQGVAFAGGGFPVLVQDEKLTGAEESGAGHLGVSVAISSDGSTALVGAPEDSVGVGAVWVFVRSGSSWVQQAKLTSTEASGEAHFGSAVALSSDGSTAIIGGSGAGSGAGVAWVFTRAGTTWSQQGGALTAAEGEEVGAGAFGSSVALSEDGSLALVGAPGDNSGAGAAWTFTRSEGGWSQFGTKLTPGESEELGAGAFGSSVALSEDGSLALVGAPGDNSGVGAAWTFARGEKSWSQLGEKLTAALDGELGAGAFGSSVALSAEGSTALVGAPANNDQAGAAWSFVRSGATWTLPEELTGGTGENGPAQFGASVALPSGASSALVGGPLDEGGTGAAWSFGRSGGAWSESGEVLTGAQTSGKGHFGASVALAASGAGALVGAPEDGSGVGAAYTFSDPPIVATGAASSIGQADAVLNATVNPNGAEVSTCQFEYGTDEHYGSNVPCAALPGSGTEAAAVSASLAGLAANTTYYFRILASGPGGSSIGHDQTFTTLPDAPTAITMSASSVSQAEATLNATVNSHGGEVSLCRFEYGPTSAYGSDAPCSPAPGSGDSAVTVSAVVKGLTPSTPYHFRVVAINAGGTSSGEDQSFSTLPNPPSVEAGASSSVAQTTATLNGSVDPNGGEVSSCRFEYGATSSYGHVVACAPAPGSGTSAVAVSASVSGLSANASSHFRLVATNAGGTSTSADQTLTTLPNPPTVEEKPATLVSQTAATLNGIVDPNGGKVTSCELEYGTSEAYGSSAPCAPEPGGGTGPVAVTAAVSGLSSDTIYHFRLVATNAGGTSRGDDQVFATSPGRPVVKLETPTSIGQTFANLKGTVNPLGGTILHCEFLYGTSETLEFETPCVKISDTSKEPIEVSAIVEGQNLGGEDAEGLKADTRYYFSILTENTYGEQNLPVEPLGEFTTLPGPSAITRAASAATQTAATLNATVNPNGADVSSCEFEYGPTSSYGHDVPCSLEPGSGTNPVAVSASVEGLAANSTYHFRVAVQAGGLVGDGQEETFKTLPDPPTVVTAAASALTESSAVLNATVNPNEGEVSASRCKFEYGLGTGYGSSVSCTRAPGVGNSPQAVLAVVSGLSPGTTYHFRIVAENAGGASAGSDETLRTTPAPAAQEDGASSTPTAGVAAFPAAGNPPTPCRVSAASTTVGLARTMGSVSIKLLWRGSGPGTCSGRLMLTTSAREHATGARSKPIVLASGTFAVGSGDARAVKLELSKLGRTLVRRAGGHLSALLVISGQASGQPQPSSQVVHIAPEVKTHRR